MQNYYKTQQNKENLEDDNIKQIKRMKYTFLIQQTTSKQCYSWILEDLTPESLYHKFEIELESGMEDGEYEFLLIENPNELEIEVDVNDIFDSYLIGGDTVIEQFGLIKLGDKKCSLQYDKKQQYLTYDR